MTSKANGKHIVVLGAGYAGLTAATRAGKHNRVTLVAPETRFRHRIRQHETAAGHPARRPSVAEVVRGRGVRHVRARATELDLTGRKVLLDTGETLAYDTLVYALGSRTAWHGVPGAAEHAYGAERAAEVGERLRTADRPGTVAVVGGGATGIEMATEIAEAHPAWKVRIVAAGQVGGWFSARGRAHVLAVMAGLGVEVHEQATVTAVDPEGLDTTAGRIPGDIVVWAASMEPLPLAAEAGLTVNAAGRAVVDRYLRSVSHPDVHVIGDAAEVAVPGTGTLRMACATALPMGRYVGRLLAGRTGKPFAFRYAVQCLSLGRREGLVQLIHGDDSMRPGVLTGRTGRITKALIVNAVVRSLR
ncbi:NAD(P)/FAD-dependent oxidoreductase [Kitasatospora sp. NPDC090091]|uniref:NAD(P)/FAD-dependent oxidoreductase n=1 Tax=Kitasatospora sp. NPDC090091 TaxID=3364081 RepID=UPI003829AB8E